MESNNTRTLNNGLIYFTNGEADRVIQQIIEKDKEIEKKSIIFTEDEIKALELINNELKAFVIYE